MPTLSTHPETVRPLTEAELLRMPDSEYMSPRQLTYFRNRLLELREELLRESDSLWPTLSDSGALADLADRATLEEEQSRMRRLRNRERQLMARIEAALTRIEAGTYGFCEDTGERIGLRRLLARPMARLTLEAQQNREHQKITYGA
jgi:DnaK suppressor protein